MTPFTEIRGLFIRGDEHKHKPPYKIADSWMKARASLNPTTPYNFVSTNDIVGGNSGSPVINVKGELVGLIFDGNIQSLPGYFVYDAAVNRAVSVDSRGMLEALRKVYNANWVADELAGGASHEDRSEMTFGGRRLRPSPLPRPVRLLGWVSLLTDAATEAVYPLLPVFITQVLGGPPVALGIVEGAADATSSVLKVVSGRWSDRIGARKPIVVLGYTLSSLVRPFIALSSTWAHVFLIRVVDRVGKGLRGAPRDAMLAALAPPGERGRVFGYHWAMDHAGAAVGPLLATVFLYFAPENYRLLFALTIIPGALAVMTLTRVPEQRRRFQPFQTFQTFQRLALPEAAEEVPAGSCPSSRSEILRTPFCCCSCRKQACR